MFIVALITVLDRYFYKFSALRVVLVLRIRQPGLPSSNLRVYFWGLGSQKSRAKGQTSRHFRVVLPNIDSSAILQSLTLTHALVYEDFHCRDQSRIDNYCHDQEADQDTALCRHFFMTMDLECAYMLCKQVKFLNIVREGARSCADSPHLASLLLSIVGFLV